MIEVSELGLSRRLAFFFGILVLMMAFFNGLASVVGAASNRKPIGTDSNPSKD
jgi:hypothetical protein